MKGLCFSSVTSPRECLHPGIILVHVSVSAISNSENASFAEFFAVPSHHLQVAIRQNPPTIAWAPLTQSVGRHEVVGALDACINVRLVCTIWKPNLLPR